MPAMNYGFTRRMAGAALFALLSLASRAASSPGRDAPRQLFSSGFEGSVALRSPDCWDMGCWQRIEGIDSASGARWPPRLGGGTARFLMLTDPVKITPATLDGYMFNRIETVPGPHGTPTRALYEEISRNVNGTGPMKYSVAQSQLQFTPRSEVPELYVGFWIKLQPDLRERMSGLPDGPGLRGGGTWRGVFAFKSGGLRADGEPADNGDYRVEFYVITYDSPGNKPYWSVSGDNVAGGDYPLVNDWTVINRKVPVPIGRWFHFEACWLRSDGADGRIWFGVDGQTIAEHRGPNMGAAKLPINRIMAPLLYSGSTMPIYQWVDDIEIWSGMPPGRGPR
jgi:hypothetical protein